MEDVTYKKKDWSATPFASTPEQAQQFIEETIKEHYDKCVLSEDLKVVLNSYEVSGNCAAAFLRHFALLYDAGESEERIRSDLEKIWDTFIAYAKKIKIFDHKDYQQYRNAGGLLPMKTLCEAAAAVRNVAGHVGLSLLESSIDGRVAFTESAAKDMSEEQRKKEEECHPVWGLSYECVQKAVKAMNPAVPDEINAFEKPGPFSDSGNNGYVLDKLTTLLETFPGPEDESSSFTDPDTGAKAREWWSINAFAANLTANEDVGRGAKNAAWPVNTAVKMIRRALEEERQFESNTPGEPSIGTFAGVVTIWLESPVRYTLEAEAGKTPIGGIILTSVPPGPLAQKHFQDDKMTIKRWRYWKSRCKEIQELANTKKLNTVKESSNLKFWKKESKKAEYATESFLSHRSLISRRTANIALGNALKTMS